MTVEVFVDNYTSILDKHSDLNKRRNDTESRISKLKSAFGKSFPIFQEHKVCAYRAGSLGRGDVGHKSDLDLFFITTNNLEDQSHIGEIKMMSEVLKIGTELHYPDFSNDGAFLKIHSSPQMLEALGAPKDDSENLFTTRMLLLLESRFLCNQNIYDEIIRDISEHYFRDSRGKKSYRPLFLLNDLLRFWRTLCLNYEIIRDEPDRPWRKKNINLKFSRMLTIFGTVLPLITSSEYKLNNLISLTKMTPMERFALGLNKINDRNLSKEFRQFLDSYEELLCWKDTQDEFPDSNQVFDELSRNAAKLFSDFIYKVMTHRTIDNELKKYLVI